MRERARRPSFGHGIAACLLAVALGSWPAGCSGDTASSSTGAHAGGSDGGATSSVGGLGGSSAEGGAAPDLKAVSQSCDTSAQCASGHCPAEDGVCCESACDTPCWSCREEKTGRPHGTCAPVLVDTDPDRECGAPGWCDGSGNCCGERPTPPGDADCPTVCSGGCEGGECVIACLTFEACRQSTLACPAGFSCRLVCTAGGACRQAELMCPDTWPCTVACGPEDACRDLAVHCSNGTCEIACTDNGCDRADVFCGKGACTATCGEGADEPDVECGEACHCAGC